MTETDDVTETDDELVRKVMDAGNPRTPMHFKELIHIVARDTGSAEVRTAVSEHHRSLGYLCGPCVRATKPLSKIVKHGR